MLQSVAPTEAKCQAPIYMYNKAVTPMFPVISKRSPK